MEIIYAWGLVICLWLVTVETTDPLTNLYESWHTYTRCSQGRHLDRGTSIDDRKNFEAIRDVHAHVDDDKDGSITESETAEYVNNTENASQKILLPKGDTQISVDELWDAWKENPVYKWSILDVIQWLKYVVKLPQYVNTFSEVKVDGKILPRLATPKGGFVQKELKVLDSTHRKKIYLRASDVILFGPPEEFQKIKEERKKNKNFQAITAIHAQLDDDKDGEIDLEESSEFMEEELETSTSSRTSSLHNHDSHITVDELWMNWQQNLVYNWSSVEVATWLRDTVGLPQYVPVFESKKIDGKLIPSLTTDKFLLKELAIVDAIHRKKINLRATDVVLFGIPEDGARSYFNDYIVLLIALLSTLICVYAFHEKNCTRKQIEQMSKDMECLHQAEENLKNMQEMLAAAETNESDNSEREQQLLDEIEAAKKEAERLRVEKYGKNQEEKIRLTILEQELSESRLTVAQLQSDLIVAQIKSPRILQKWLRMTYRKEAKHFQYRKRLALNQMKEAKEACAKVSKTRRSMLGVLRLAHSESIDDVDHKILNARSALAEVTNDLQERQHRWKQIESLINFPIVSDGLFYNLPGEKQSRKSSIAQAIAEFTSLACMSESPLKMRSSSDEDSGDVNNHVDSNENSARSIDVKKHYLKRNSGSYNTSTDSRESFSPVNGTASGDSKDAVTTEHSVQLHTTHSLPSELGDSSSENINMTARTPEKSILRSNTAPTNLKGYPERLVNKNHRLANIDNRRSLSLHKSEETPLQASHSLQNLRKENRNYSNGDISDDLSYISDESITVAGASVKKRKGFSKLFRRSKLNR